MKLSIKPVCLFLAKRCIRPFLAKKCLLGFKPGLLIVFLPLLLVGPALAVPVEPEVFSDAELVEDQLSVRELMRLETVLALEAARLRQKRKHLHPGKVSAAFSDQTDHETDFSTLEPRLLAIYGVGKNLWAEVLIRQKPVVYRQGHPAPVGSKLSNAAFRLKTITSQCIELESQKGAEHLCLSPG